MAKQLLGKEVNEALVANLLSRSDALKVYACNIMTQEGETEGYTVSDHIRALFSQPCGFTIGNIYCVLPYDSLA